MLVGIPADVTELVASYEGDDRDARKADSASLHQQPRQVPPGRKQFHHFAIFARNHFEIMADLHGVKEVKYQSINCQGL